MADIMTERNAAQEAWDELVHKDDRTSPEEYPEMCLITFEELQDYMQRFFLTPTSQTDALVKAQTAISEALKIIGDPASGHKMMSSRRDACAVWKILTAASVSRAEHSPPTGEK